MTKQNKSKVISLRIEPKTKAALLKMAEDARRNLPDFLRLILDDIANNKIKINL
ncbi:MAG: hypothetical protein ABI723_00080 [Bacteroidia bacterium]